MSARRTSTSFLLLTDIFMSVPFMLTSYIIVDCCEGNEIKLCVNTNIVMLHL